MINNKKDSPVDHGSPNSDTSSITDKTNKPGRKPLTEEEIKNSEGDPKSRRKAQNRAAQRAFRERRVNYVKELEDRIKVLESEKDELSKKNDHHQSTAKLEEENRGLKKIIQQLQLENAILGGAAPSFDMPISKISETANTNDRPQKLLRSINNNNKNHFIDNSTKNFFSSPASIHSNSTSSSPESIFDNVSVLINKNSDNNNNNNIPPSTISLFDNNPSFTPDLLTNNSLSLPSDILSNFDTDQLLNQIAFESNSPFSLASPSPSSNVISNNIESQSQLQHKDASNILNSLLAIDDEIDDSDTKSSSSSSGTNDQQNNSNSNNGRRLSITKAWDVIASHPKFEEFDIEFLCNEMKTKANCACDEDEDENLIKEKLDKFYSQLGNKQ
ncbi:unnamed protein product [Cunninghamella blakesleeana]